MEFIIKKCKKCGNTKTIPDTDRDIYLYRNDKEDCAICGGEYELVKIPGKESNITLNRNKTYNIGKDSEGIPIAEVVHMDLLEGMKKNISKMENDKVWDIIEGFKSAHMRLAHRKIFLEAGGDFPITEIKI